MLSVEKIGIKLKKYNYNLNENKENKRFMDQKCTPDVLSVVSECILNFEENEFKTNDIRYSEYSKELIKEVFNKPDIEVAENEFDKFFSQPLKTLAYAGVLIETKVGRNNVYCINEKEILEYISLKDRYAHKFLTIFIEKFLKENFIFSKFKLFFGNETPEHFRQLKQGFSEFMIEKTNINGVTECNRIFTKVLNPLSCIYNKKGTKRGYMSSDKILFAGLLYNTVNWRDKNKPKEMTREKFLRSIDIESNKNNIYQVEKAKKL